MDRGVKDCNELVMDLLGTTFKDLFNFCLERFTVETVIRLAGQMISRSEYMDTKNLMPRDSKPDRNWKSL